MQKFNYLSFMQTSRSASFRVPFVVIAIILCMSCGEKKTKTDIPSSAPVKSAVNTVVPDFNADSAYDFVAKQVAFGPRIPGTASQTKCAQWLNEKLKSY